MKVVVYAIALNEASFAARWMDSMREADAVVVLDTGSRDGTAKALRKLGATVVSRRIRPWRFDVARNESMKLVPLDADLLVCTDLDEVLLPGWRSRLESAWQEALRAGIRPTTATYDYVWRFDASGQPDVIFRYEKVHRPGVAVWKYPVHEVLDYSVPRVDVAVPGMRLEHHADPAKSRGSYLPLLELSARENPADARVLYYLGREYSFHARWQEAIDTLTRHLACAPAEAVSERAASMRIVAKGWGALGNSLQQTRWLWRAVNEAPKQREAAFDLAKLAYAAQDWEMAERATGVCLSRTVRTLSYLTEGEAWGPNVWGYRAKALFELKRYDEAAAALKEYQRHSAPEKKEVG